MGMRSKVGWFAMMLVVLLALPVSAQSPGSSAEPAGSSGASAGGVRSAGYDMRLRELQEQLDELKEDVFRSRSRLFLLREQILQDAMGGAQAIIRHRNELGRNFRLVQVLYSLDGTQVYAATSSTSQIAELEELEILRGALLPGAHNLSVQFVIEGRGRGIFAYPKVFRFTVTTSHAFTVDGGQTVELDVIGSRSGRGSTPYEQRPTIRFEELRRVTRVVTQDDLSSAVEQP